MEVTQFQFEPAAATRDSRYTERQSRFASAGHSVHSAIDALMLGMRLRGWLTDDEKELLDRLAADNYLTFLVRGREYFHPEGLDLFPLDLIQTAQPEAVEALFRHRYQPKADPHCGGYDIHSACINEPGTDPITLGMFGGGRQSRQNVTETYFAELVERFREAATRAEEFVRSYGQGDDSDDPIIIVDRCSGRLFHTNPAASTLLGTTDRNLVGREFREIKERFHSLAGSYRWTLKNLDPENGLYTIISIQKTGSHVTGEGKKSAVQLCIQKMHNKITGVKAAAGRLLSVSSANALKDVEDVAELIVTRTDQLYDLLGGLHALFDYESLPRTSIDPSSLFDEVLDRLTEDLGGKWTISNESPNMGLQIMDRAQATRSLFVAVISAHLAAVETDSTRRLNCLKHLESSRIVFEISSVVAANSRTETHHEWRTYAEQLASTMAVPCTWDQTNDGHSLTTKIEIRN